MNSTTLISSNSERRANVRVAFDGAVSAEQIPPRPRYQFTAVLPEDLSEGGLRVRSRQCFPIQSRLLVNLDTETGAPLIRAAGQVVWVARAPHLDQWEAGIPFSDLHDRDRLQLRRIVHKRTATD